MQENLLHIGLCLPKSCTNRQIKFLVQNFFNSLETGIDENHDMKSRVVEVKNLKFSPKILLKHYFLVFAAFVFITKFLNHLAAKVEKEMKDNENKNIALGIENKVKLPLRKKLIRCFNFERNMEKMTSKDTSSSAVLSISGLR